VAHTSASDSEWLTLHTVGDFIYLLYLLTENILLWIIVGTASFTEVLYVQSNSPGRKRRRMVSDVSDIPSQMAKYDTIDDSTPHITRCPPSLAMHWASMSSDTAMRNRRGSVIRR